jgi:very-short-patch-repair endonuclease
VRDRKLTTHARSMRREPTEPETRLWLALRAKRFEAVKFRRQKVIGPYIVDFAARDPMLVIEVDGDTHAGRERQNAERTHYLEQQGYRVIRFSNQDVMTNLEGVLTHLSNVIALPLSQPSPLNGRGL